MNERVTEKIVNYLEVEKDSMSGIKISYYIETVISEMEKLMILFIVFSVLGYFRDILLVVSVVIMLRPYIGGTHKDTFMGCIIKTTLFCAIPVLIAEYMMVCNGAQYGISVLMLLYIIIFAPATSKYRPKYEGKDLLKIKLKGMIMVLLINCLYHSLSSHFKIELMIVMCMLLMDTIVAQKIRFKFQRKEASTHEERGSTAFGKGIS